MSKKDAQQPGTAVATTPSDALAPPAAIAGALADHAGAGLEGIGANDRAIPFIGIVQTGSPQRKKMDAAYIAGAEEGDIFNTVTQSLTKGSDGILVVPVHYQKVWNLWVPRDEGGGFLGSYADRERTTVLVETQRLAEYAGDPQVAETANHFVLAQEPDGSWMPAMISMTSTKLKVSRNWATRMSMIRLPADGSGTRKAAPSFARVYRLTTVEEANDKGAYHNFKVEDTGWVSDDLFREAVLFRDQILAGRLAVDYTKADTTAASGPVADFEDDDQPEM